LVRKPQPFVLFFLSIAFIDSRFPKIRDFNQVAIKLPWMGWQDYHLHTFTIGKKRYTDNPESREEGALEDLFRLVALIKCKGRTFGYEYGFGDDWRHTITIEESRYFNPG